MIITLPQLKEYLGVESSSEDSILTFMIEASQGFMEEYTARYFEPRTETRHYPWIVSQEIWLDHDLLSLSQLKLDSQIVPASDIVLLPHNRESKDHIQLKNPFFPEDRWSKWEITGTWGFSSSPSKDIQMIALRLAAFLYRQKDSQVFDVTALTDVGQLVIPQGIPKDIMLKLKSYKRML